MLRLEGFDPAPVPGPAPTALVGERALKQRFLDDPVGSLLALRPHGDVVGVVEEDPAIVCVFGPHLTQQVLDNPVRFRNLESWPLRRASSSALAITDHGLPRMNGRPHERHRRTMSAAFTDERLDEQAAQVTRAAISLVDRWPVDAQVRLDGLCRDLVRDVLVSTLFGLPLDGTGQALGDLLAKLHDARTGPTPAWLPEVNLPGLPHRRANLLAREVTRHLRGLVEARRSGRPRDALGHVVAAASADPSGLSDDELIGQAVALFAGAHEPTAMALQWTLFLLDQHADRLEAIQAEIDETLAERPPTRADLPQLGKLDRAVKESLRVLPPVPVLDFRVVTEPVELDGVPLPIDANVVLSPLAAHHDGARFARPRAFDPGRWFGLSPAPFTYMPFGAGLRGCLAAAFAGESVRLILAVILQRRRLRCRAGARVDRLTRGGVLQLKGGLTVRITRPKDPTDPARRVQGDIHQLVDLPSEQG